MKKTLLVLILLVSNIGLANTKETFFGKWVIKAKIASAVGVSALSNKDIDSLIGKKVEYSSTIAKYDKEGCKNPKYKKITLSKSDFLTSERISLTKLDIKSNTVLSIEVLDDKGERCLGIGGLFYIKDRDTLITIIDGVYFKLGRI